MLAKVCLFFSIFSPTRINDGRLSHLHDHFDKTRRRQGDLHQVEDVLAARGSIEEELLSAVSRRARGHALDVHRLQRRLETIKEERKLSLQPESVCLGKSDPTLLEVVGSKFCVRVEEASASVARRYQRLIVRGLLLESEKISLRSKH